MTFNSVSGCRAKPSRKWAKGARRTSRQSAACLTEILQQLLQRRRSQRVLPRGREPERNILNGTQAKDGNASRCSGKQRKRRTRLLRRFVRRFHAKVSRGVAAFLHSKSSRAAPKSVANRADVRCATPATSSALARRRCAIFCAGSCASRKIFQVFCEFRKRNLPVFVGVHLLKQRVHQAI